MAVLTRQERDTLNQVSAKLKVNPPDLEALIQFESRWNPLIKNPKSSAQGLIQIINSRAMELGYRSSLDAVTKNPTISLQLKNIVYPYLKQFMPFPSRQSLAMAVFLPTWRYKSRFAVLPKRYQDFNPGIKTVGDYMQKVYPGLYSNVLPKLVILGVLIFLSYKTFRKGSFKIGKQKDKSKKSTD